MAPFRHGARPISRLLAFALVVLGSQLCASSPSPFDIELQTLEIDTQVCIPLGDQIQVNLTVYWGDFSGEFVTELVSCGFGDQTHGIFHSYANASVYTVSLFDLSLDGGFVKHFGFSGAPNFGAPGGWAFMPNVRLLAILSWGDVRLESLEWAFRGTSFLEALPNDLPSSVVSLRGAFAESNFHNYSIAFWDVSHVRDLQDLFFRNGAFNSPLGGWNVSSVENMRGVFSESIYNQELAYWDVSKVVNMLGMFRANHAFNKPLGSWDVSRVVTMRFMFADALSFNRNVSAWPVHCVRQWDEFSLGSPLSSAPSFGVSFDQCAINPLQLEIDVVATPAAVCIPFGTQRTVDLLVSWGDGPFLESHEATESCQLGDLTFGLVHSFSTTGSFQVLVWDLGAANFASVRHFGFDVTDNYDATIGWSQFASVHLTCVSDWGNVFVPTSLAWAFRQTSYLSCVPPTLPSSVVSLRGAFAESNFNDSSISSWGTSHVQDLQHVFFRSSSFDQPLNGWDVSSVTNMREVFSESVFNQPLASWDVSTVVSMLGMFRANQAFNQPLEGWNVSRVVTMQQMFSGALAFAGDVSSWSVRCVRQWDDFSLNSSIPSQPSFGGAYDQCTFNPLQLQLQLEPWSSITPLTVCIPLGTQQAVNLFVSWGDGSLPEFYKATESCKLGDLTFGLRRSFLWTSVVQVLVWEVSSARDSTAIRHFGFDVTGDYDTAIGWSQFAFVHFTCVSDWGNVFSPVSLGWAFRRTSYLSCVPPTLPSSVVSLRGAFAESTFNGASISSWRTSRVQDLQDLFFRNPVFNQPLNSWDVSSATNMRRVFSESRYNQPLYKWDVSNAVSMYAMFRANVAFNQPLRSWNVCKVVNLSHMFLDASAFNEDVSNWCVTSVTNYVQFAGGWNNLPAAFWPPFPGLGPCNR